MNYKIEIDEADSSVISSKNMKHGDIGIIESHSGVHKGRLIMKTKWGYMDLKDATCTWSNGGMGEWEPNFEIRLLPKGTEIKLIIN